MRIDQNLMAELLARAKRKGATGADIMAVEGGSASVQVRLSAVDKLSKAQEKRLDLRVYFGRRSAGASTSDLSPASLDELVETTCALARAVVEDPYGVLPDPAALAKEWPNLDLYDSETVPMDRMIELATRTEKAALAVDPRLSNSEGAEFSTFGGRTVFADSHGFYGDYQGSSFSCAVAPIAVQEGLMQRDYWYTVGRKLNRLDSPEAVGPEARHRGTGHPEELPARHLRGPQAGARLDGQRGAQRRRGVFGRRDQPLPGARHGHARGDRPLGHARVVRHGADRVRDQHGNRRLFPRGGRLLDRKRRTGLSSRGDHDRGQPERHVDGRRSDRQRPRVSRAHRQPDGKDRRDDRGGRVKRCPRRHICSRPSIPKTGTPRRAGSSAKSCSG